MADLSLKLADFLAYTGDYLGWGKGADFGYKAWTDKKLADLKFWVGSGVRQFYYPPVLPNETVAHSWSFLTPSTTLALAAGVSTVELPDDFEAIIGSTGVTTTERRPLDLRVGHARDIYQQQAARTGYTGQPLLVAVEPLKTLTEISGQRYQLLVYPPPDVAYTLDVRYKIAGHALSGDRPYVYGGQKHAETVLAACIAAVELHRDNIFQGPRYMQFVERLRASVSLDRENQPDLYGYNADRSDRAGYNRHGWRDRTGIVTVNGLTPE